MLSIQRFSKTVQACQSFDFTAKTFSICRLLVAVFDNVKCRPPSSSRVTDCDALNRSPI